jgi:glutamyl-tRNA reductase
MGWLRSLDAVEGICRYRENGEQLRNTELARAQRLLASGKPAEEVLQNLARGLTNKLLHTPCTNLRQAGYDGRDDLLQAAEELYRTKGGS